MGKRPKCAGIYARVSTLNGQTPENQLRELREVAANARWEVVGEFVDRGVSGARGRDQRPAFDTMWKKVARREIDVVMAWSVDRLGRSLQHLVHFLGDLQACGADLYLHKQGVDTTTPGGKALFQMMGVCAEFEREMIRERVNAGLARARAEGKTLGRPKVTPEIEKAIRAARAQGMGMLKIARAVRVGSGTVQRVLAVKNA
jgi:DNA invertase Pin-like site-specific DNA recombinase